MVLDSYEEVLPDVSAMRVHPAAVHAGVEAEAGVETLLEGGGGDPHPVAGAHRPVRVDHVVQEELEPVLPVQPEVSPGDKDMKLGRLSANITTDNRQPTGYLVGKDS